MCYLADTSLSFFFSYLFLFFSAGKWWCSSGQCSQVSSSYTLLLWLFVHLQTVLNSICITWWSLTTWGGGCMPVCAWACLYLAFCISKCICTRLELFLSTLHAVIGVMCSKWGDSKHYWAFPALGRLVSHVDLGPGWSNITDFCWYRRRGGEKVQPPDLK